MTVDAVINSLWSGSHASRTSPRPLRTSTDMLPEASFTVIGRRCALHIAQPLAEASRSAAHQLPWRRNGCGLVEARGLGSVSALLQSMTLVDQKPRHGRRAA